MSKIAICITPIFHSPIGSNLEANNCYSVGGSNGLRFEQGDYVNGVSIHPGE